MSVKHFIHTHIDAGFSTEDDLPFKTEFITIPKHTVISAFDKVERYAYYLLSGVVKISMRRDDGQERVLDFFFPGQFFSAYTSFLTQQVSDVAIEALSECTAEKIQYAEMQNAYKSSLLANKLGRVVAEYYYIRKTNREKDFLVRSAAERYKDLFDSRPELVQQIPVQLIARYLGIEPESLSRIRKSFM